MAKKLALLLLLLLEKDSHSFISYLTNSFNKLNPQRRIHDRAQTHTFSLDRTLRIFSSPNIQGTPPPDPIEYVKLLGKITPNPDVEDEGNFDFVNAITDQGDAAIDPRFVKWLQEKVELNKQFGNEAAIQTLETVLAGISSVVAKKLEPATELLSDLVASETDCEKVRMLRQRMILPGGEAHPYYQEPKEGEPLPSIDPMEFKIAYDVLQLQLHTVEPRDSETIAALEDVLEMTKKVLNGDPVD